MNNKDKIEKMYKELDLLFPESKIFRDFSKFRYDIMNPTPTYTITVYTDGYDIED